MCFMSFHELRLWTRVPNQAPKYFSFLAVPRAPNSAPLTACAVTPVNVPGQSRVLAIHYLCLQVDNISHNCLVLVIVENWHLHQVTIQLLEKSFLWRLLKLDLPLAWCTHAHGLLASIVLSSNALTCAKAVYWPLKDTALSRISCVPGDTEFTKCRILLLVLFATQLLIISVFSSLLSSSLTGNAS